MAVAFGEAEEGREEGDGVGGLDAALVEVRLEAGEVLGGGLGRLDPHRQPPK